MTRWRILLVGSLAVALAALAPNASAGGPTFTIRAAKEKDGPYKREQGLNLAAGQKKTQFWRVRSLIDSDQEMVLSDESTGELDGYRRRWFRGKREISSEVKGSGFAYTLAGHATRYFKSKVSREGAGGTFCLLGVNAAESPGGSAGAFFNVNGNCVN